MFDLQTIAPTTTRKPLCLVTGAASGLGFELARAFAEAGCDLVLAGDGSVELELVSEELALFAPDTQLHWVTADLTRAAGPAHLHHKLGTLQRPIDIFVANAAVGAWGDFGRAASLEDELATAQVNALSTLHLARLIAKDMVARGHGQIVLGSTYTTSACAFDTLLSATRAFTAALVDGLAAELEGHNVYVTALSPEIDRDGPSARLHDPDALLAAARETTMRARGNVARTRELTGQVALDLTMQARLNRYLTLAAETPMA